MVANQPQNKTQPNDIATTYGPLVLSFLAILLIAIAGFAHDLDWTTVLEFVAGILGANGLYGATRWQAAPGLLADIQAIIKQLSEHIQVLQAQQVNPVQPTAQDGQQH